MSPRIHHLALLVALTVLATSCRTTFDGDSDSADAGDGDGDNLLVNGGYEEVLGGLPKNWNYEGDGALGQMAAENLEDPYAGLRTLRLSVPGDSRNVHYAEMSQVVTGTYPAGTTFDGLIQGRCIDLCDTLPASIYLFVSYTEPDPEGNDYASLGFANTTLGANWSTMSGTITIEHDADFVVFSLTGSNGIFDYDEAYLAVVPEG